jgi:hypothetical protein
MKLQDITPDQIPGISSVHAGTAEPGEIARLLTEPSAVLRGAGLDLAEHATPNAIVISPREGGRNLVIIVDENGTVVAINTGPYSAK